MTRRQAQALALIRAAAGISRAELAAAMAINPRTASIYCNNLRQMGHVRPTGIGQTSRWVEASPMRGASSIFAYAASVAA